MTKFQVLGVAALALLTLAPTPRLNVGVVRSVVARAERWSADSWAGSPERQLAPRLVPLPARPDPLVRRPRRAPSTKPLRHTRALRARISIKHRRRCWSLLHRRRRPPHRRRLLHRRWRPRPAAEAVLQKNGKPVVGVTFPSDWKQVTGDRYISGVSADGQAYAMIAPLEGAADKPGGINRVKQGLLQYLQDIKYDDLTETKRGALVVTGTAKGKKAGVDVVFAAGVLDAGAGQIVGAAFVVDSRIEDYYKETIRQICQTIRVGDDFAAKK